MRMSYECHTSIINNDWIEIRHPTSHILRSMSAVECLVEHIFVNLSISFYFASTNKLWLLGYIVKSTRAMITGSSVLTRHSMWSMSKR